MYIRQSLINKLYHDSKQGILMFPNGEHDDLQDALVQSINRLLNRRKMFVYEPFSLTKGIRGLVSGGVRKSLGAPSCAVVVVHQRHVGADGG